MIWFLPSAFYIFVVVVKTDVGEMVRENADLSRQVRQLQYQLSSEQALLSQLTFDKVTVEQQLYVSTYLIRKIACIVVF